MILYLNFTWCWIFNQCYVTLVIISSMKLQRNQIQGILIVAQWFFFIPWNTNWMHDWVYWYILIENKMLHVFRSWRSILPSHILFIVATIFYATAFPWIIVTGQVTNSFNQMKMSKSNISIFMAQNKGKTLLRY